MRVIHNIRDEWDIAVPETFWENVQRSIGFKRGWKRHNCTAGHCWIRKTTYPIDTPLKESYKWFKP